jgi:O-antigen ligase
LILKTHIHNSYIQALIHTGVIGAIPFVVALLFGWFLLLKVLFNRAKLPPVHQHLVIQVAGVAAFLSFRTLFESTGAFFGVDWLLLAPLLLYVHALNHYREKGEQSSQVNM